MRGNKKSKEIWRELRWRVFGKSQYGEHWKPERIKWYEDIHNSNHLLHDNFKKYLQEKNDIQTVLEVGCGAGVYPIKNRNLFSNMTYTGIDFSEAAISYCKKHSDFEFICGDFIKMNITMQYDLVFSHAVVDHVYDIDTFIRNIVTATKKYAYINSYRGYFPTLQKHKTNWFENEGIYYNDLSIPQIKNTLLDCGLDPSEFIIRSQESGQSGQNVNLQTVIEITKKS